VVALARKDELVPLTADAGVAEVAAGTRLTNTGAAGAAGAAG